MKPRRTRSPHPGVVLIRPDAAGRHPYWRARFVDPDSGKLVKVRLDPMALATIETRRGWAIRKATAIAKRSMDLEAGAARDTGTELTVAVERYFSDHPHLRASTLDLNRSAVAKLTQWAIRGGIESADDLTGPRLAAFRAELVREPRRVHLKGGKRGALKSTAEPRSPHTINRELRSVRTILGYLRKLGLLPRLTTDDLRDGLERLPTSSERIDYRKPAELQRLLEAAVRHDAAVFTATRAELAGLRSLGTTERFQPLAPVVAAALLTGMRFAEVVDLDWKQVDLEALDNEGRAVGEIYLSAATKTKRARTIGLEVSPALRTLLAALQLRSGGKGSVFGHTRGTATAAAKRLRSEYGAPPGSGWQALRRTCGTYLTNAPGIFGAASAYRSAKQLGHSVQVAEKHYVGVTRGIPLEARTLEAAMQIEAQMKLIIRAVSGGLTALSPAVASGSGQGSGIRQ